MPAWFETNPERLRFELDALAEAGIRHERDEECWSRGKLRLQLEVNGTRLIADYPDWYPYFRFEVSAPDLSLPRHQNPFGKNLCLLGRATAYWRTTDTLAAFLQQRLPTVLGTSTGAPLPEELQGEPVSDYFPYGQSTSILIDSDWSIDPSVQRGRLLIGLSAPLFHQRQPQPIRGAVLEVTTRDGEVLARAHDNIRKLFRETISGAWYRTEHLPLRNNPHEFLTAVAQEYPSALYQWVTTGGDRVSITGLIFPEEHTEGQFGDGWLFVVGVQPKHKPKSDAYFARAERSGRADLQRRIPELVNLSERRVALVGLGCIGAPSALHFARAGVGELRVVDYDVGSAGGSVRWPLGLSATGVRKPDAIRDFVALNYPYTSVVPYYERIGDVAANDAQMLEILLDGVDLLYDASAEHGVNHVLSDLARAKHIPYVCISTTPGGWGGRIIRVRPELTGGCWMCVLHYLNDAKIPTPPAAELTVQPAGCANPTFTGASFDVEEIALMGVRTAASTLCAGYPAMPWDVAICRLRAEDGALITPTWETFDLPRHPECKNHEV